MHQLVNCRYATRREKRSPTAQPLQLFVLTLFKPKNVQCARDILLVPNSRFPMNRNFLILWRPSQALFAHCGSPDATNSSPCTQEVLKVHSCQIAAGGVPNEPQDFRRTARHLAIFLQQRPLRDNVSMSSDIDAWRAASTCLTFFWDPIGVKREKFTGCSRTASVTWGLLRPAAPFVPFEDAAEKRFALTPDPTSPSYVAPTEEEHMKKQYDQMRFEMSIESICCACCIQVCKYVASRCMQRFIFVGHVWWPCLVITFGLPFTRFAVGSC